MAFRHYSTSLPAAIEDGHRHAINDVLNTLIREMGSKRARTARKQLLAFATRLETVEGRHIPGPNVIPLRGPSWSERQREDEAERSGRERHASVIRQMVERYL